MKKNFVKKLALGLAFTVAVGSVPTTNAAAAKTVYPSFKSKTTADSRKTLKVGQTKKYGTNNSSKWSFYKAKVGNSKVATVKLSRKGKFIKVTGVKAGKTQVRAYFKNYKTKEVYKNALLHVQVKNAEEALKLESVQATGVKKLVVTFNKAVDTTKATVAVKKGTAAPNVASTVWADDKKSVTLNMGSKLTEGTYDVSVTGLTDAALTGSVAVKDEVITSIEFVGNNLVLTAKNASTAAISYKTLNQYGERMMDPDRMTVATSFGKGEVTQPCSTKKNGIVTVEITAEILNIIGTTGTITIIDSSKGVTASANITLSDVATPKTMTVAGIYNLTEGKFEDMYRGCNPSEYVLLVQVQDQYGNALDASAVNKANIDTNFVGSVTNVEVELDADKNEVWYDETINDVEYIALPFALKADAKAAAVGTFYFTFVNPNSGLLASASFTVADATVIKSINVYANDAIYDGQPNELGFEAVDANGNAVTKYSELSDAVEVATDDGKVEWKKQADGTAKLVFTPAMNISAENGKGKELATVMVTANADIPTSYMVKPVNFTVYQKKVATEVVGLKSGSATAIATNGAIKVKITDLIIEDQYSNVLTANELKKISVDVKVVEGDATAAATVTNADPLFINAGTTTTAVVSYSVNSQKEAYTVKYAVVDPTKATGLKIVSINDGYTVDATSNDTINTVVTNSAIVVTGTVSGKTVVIPESQFVISGKTVKPLGDRNTVGVKQTTETGTVEVTVDTTNGPVVLTKEVKYSNTTPVVTKLELKDIPDSITAGTIDASKLEGLFDIHDQYGTVNPLNKKSIKYTLTYLGSDKKEISHNSTNSVSVEAKLGEEYSVTATIGDLTVTTEFTVE